MASASVDELYGLPPDQFVPSRDALVKALKKDGDKEAAAAVKALRKPSIAAWAVNQVMRTQKADARELADAGEELRSAKGGPQLRAAMARERAAVEALVRAARGLLLEDGSALSQATLDRVRTTLHAAASDAAVREEVLAGRVAKEREAVGIAGLGGGEGDDLSSLLTASLPAKEQPKERPATTKKTSTAPAKKMPAKRTKADDEAAKREAEARREAERERQARRKELMAAIRQAKAEAGKLGLAESTAERAADAAQAAAEEAQARLERALEELKEKSAAAEAARRRLDEAEKALEAFEDA